MSDTRGQEFVLNSNTGTEWDEYFSSESEVCLGAASLYGMINVPSAVSVVDAMSDQGLFSVMDFVCGDEILKDTAESIRSRVSALTGAAAPHPSQDPIRATYDSRIAPHAPPATAAPPVETTMNEGHAPQRPAEAVGVANGVQADGYGSRTIDPRTYAAGASKPSRVPAAGAGCDALRGVVLKKSSDLVVVTEDAEVQIPVKSLPAVAADGTPVPPLLRFDAVVVDYHRAQGRVLSCRLDESATRATADRRGPHLCRVRNEGRLYNTYPSVSSAAVADEIARAYGCVATVDVSLGPQGVECKDKLVCEWLLRKPVDVPQPGGGFQTVPLEYPLRTDSPNGFYLMAPLDDDVPFIRIPAASYRPSDPSWWSHIAVVHIDTYIAANSGRPTAVGRITELIPHLAAAMDRAPGVGRVPPPLPDRSREPLDMRVDLTESCYVFSIDQRGTMLYDDAFSVTCAADGGWVVMVHVADPTEDVPEGSELDKHLREKLVDLYIPQRDAVDRMMPDGAAAGCTARGGSLDAGAVRAAVSFVFHVASNGEVRSDAIMQTWIRSRCCLDMLDDMSWSDFLHGSCAAAGVSQVNRAAALQHANTLHEVMLRMMNNCGYLQEATQGREGPSRLVQYFMIRAKQLASRRVAELAPDERHHIVYQTPGEEMRRELSAVDGRVQRALQRQGPLLDASSETALCASLEKLRGEQLYPALVRQVNKLLTATQHGMAHPTAAGAAAGAAGWVAHAEVPCTSPLRRYQDLVILRILCQAPRTRMTHMAIRELDARTVQKKRLGAKLKRTAFIAALFGSPPTRTRLPALCTVRVVAFDIVEGDVKITLFDETLNEQWTMGLNAANHWDYRYTEYPLCLYLRWRDDPKVAEFEVLPYMTTFPTQVTVRAGQGYGDYRYAHAFVSPVEWLAGARELPVLPPLLGIDRFEKYVEVCGPPPVDFLRPGAPRQHVPPPSAAAAQHAASAPGGGCNPVGGGGHPPQEQGMPGAAVCAPGSAGVAQPQPQPPTTAHPAAAAVGYGVAVDAAGAPPYGHQGYHPRETSLQPLPSPEVPIGGLPGAGARGYSPEPVAPS